MNTIDSGLNISLPAVFDAPMQSGRITACLKKAGWAFLPRMGISGARFAPTTVLQRPIFVAS